MKTLLGAAAAIGLLASPALADDDHDCVPTGAPAKPASEIIRILEANGYPRIEELETDDGCYKVEGYDAQGMAVELRVDPGTGEIVKMELDD